MSDEQETNIAGLLQLKLWSGKYSDFYYIEWLKKAEIQIISSWPTVTFMGISPYAWQIWR